MSTGSGSQDPGARYHSVGHMNVLIVYQGSSFATGIEVQDKRKRVLVISTGSKSVDAILGGAKFLPRILLRD